MLIALFWSLVSSTFTYVWLRNLQSSVKELEVWCDQLEDYQIEVELDVEDLARTADTSTPQLDAVVYAAELTEEQEWDARFVFAKARARLWSSEDVELTAHVVQEAA